MTRRTFPRREAVHATVAAEVLALHARSTDLQIGLPVPIELIIEQTYGLQILSDEIEEPVGSKILGALDPSQRLIILNSRHQAMFDQWVGPERFTLAHELAHWIYDAENPDQLSLDLETEAQPVFCYHHREAAALNEDLRVREVNANKLAANLLLPEHLVRQADIDWVLREFRAVAALWGVSQTTLRIRLESLALLDDLDLARLPMN